MVARSLTCLSGRVGRKPRKERRYMIKRDTRKGLSLGSIIALLASSIVLGGAAAPASAETTPMISPAAGTSYTMLITEDFQIKTRLGTSMDPSYITSLKYQIEKTTGFALSVSAQRSIGELTAVSLSNWGSATSVLGTATMSVVAAGNPSTVSDNVLAIQVWSTSNGTANSVTSLSASVTVNVTAFIDINANNVLDTGEPASTRQAISFVPWSGLGATVDIADVVHGDTRLTGSSVIPATVNREQLTSSFVIEVVGDTQPLATTFGGSSKSNAITGNALAQAATNFVSVSSTTLVPQSAVSYSVRLYYGTPAQGTQVAVKNISSGTRTVAAISVAPVVGANLIGTTSGNWIVRPNQTYTVEVLATTGSPAVSVSGAVLSVAITGTTLELGAKEISINGAAFTTSYPTALSLTTGANGRASFTIRTTGFVNDNNFTVTVTRQGITGTGTFTTKAPVFTVANVFDNYFTAPGTAAAISYTVTDQWGENSARADQRLKVVRTATTGFNYSETTSYVAVSAGAATFNYSPQPATATGSTTVTVTLERLNSDTGVYTADSGSSGVTTNINVSSTANAFGTGLAASRAASVSYFPNTVSWVAVSGTVANTGSAVVVTGNSTLVFRVSSAVPATTSGTITVRAGSSGAYSFEVAALRAGNQTLTLTNGTATTTSLVVVAAAGADMGSTITWDTTTIESGKTKVVTGTLTDANGNPVETSATRRTSGTTASILVTFGGTAGVVVGNTPTSTDADGKFRVSVLTSAADSGTLTLTATYNKSGADTATADRVTSVQSIAVTPAAAPEVNAVIGSFNGRWAVRVENAKGSVVSVKAGNRWVKFSSLNNNYLFSRKSVVGRTIAVSVWVDGELQNSQTITIK